MIVSNLIELLYQLPQDMEVVFDASGDNSEVFKLVSVEEVDEVETELGEKLIMLSCGGSGYDFMAN